MEKLRVKLKVRYIALACSALTLTTAWIFVSQYREVLTFQVLKEQLNQEVRLPAPAEHSLKVPRDDAEIDELGTILKRKLLAFPDEPSQLPKRICGKEDPGYMSYPCVDKRCSRAFSSSPETRVRQLLERRNLTAVESVLSVMRKATEAVKPHKYVIATSSSANHYDEMQALVYNIHKYMLPQISNYTFVIFDLGLTDSQRRLTLIEKADILLYHDTSVRWFDHTNATRVFTDAKERGMQLAIDPSGPIGRRTAPETFAYFGDLACQYMPHGELQGGIGVYHNEKFVVDLVMGVWVTCALNESCIMCHHPSFAMHRHDQSALGIIVSKLYGNRTSLVTAYGPQLEIKREDHMHWFT